MKQICMLQNTFRKCVTNSHTNFVEKWWSACLCVSCNWCRLLYISTTSMVCCLRFHDLWLPFWLPSKYWLGCLPLRTVLFHYIVFQRTIGTSMPTALVLSLQSTPTIGIAGILHHSSQTASLLTLGCLTQLPYIEVFSINQKLCWPPQQHSICNAVKSLSIPNTA